MMSSPFTTIEEFNGALDGPTGGAIYTFATNPGINAIALLASVGIFVWFIVSTYRTHTTSTSRMDKSLNHLITFIAVGLLSFVAASHRQMVRPNTPEVTAQREVTQREVSRGVYQSAARQLPLLGLLGIVSAGLPSLQRLSNQKRGRRSRFSQSYRPRQ